MKKNIGLPFSLLLVPFVVQLNLWFVVMHHKTILFSSTRSISNNIGLIVWLFCFVDSYLYKFFFSVDVATTNQL